MSTGRIATLVLSLYIALVFVQSLFFKFTGSPETDHIFGTLEVWATNTFGLSGLFAEGGVFSAHVVGSVELVASVLLIVGLFAGALWTSLGALIALGVISGAIFFHLFTPLGVEVVNADGTSDGGLLFFMACGVFVSAAILLFTHRGALPVVGPRLAG